MVDQKLVPKGDHAQAGDLIRAESVEVETAGGEAAIQLWRNGWGAFEAPVFEHEHGDAEDLEVAAGGHVHYLGCDVDLAHLPDVRVRGRGGFYRTLGG